MKKKKKKKGKEARGRPGSQKHTKEEEKASSSPSCTDDMGVVQHKVTHVFIMSSEDSEGPTIQACTIWTELVGQDEISLR